MQRSLKIVSGGQTGVDRAALEWALANGIPHGGWCPKGRKAEDGLIPPRFLLKETDHNDYATRTLWNVRDSDGTVIFSERAKLTGGTQQTAGFATQFHRPLLCLVSSMDVNQAAAQLEAFVLQHRIAVLNVAGPCASQALALPQFVKTVLSQALRPAH